MKKSPPYLFIWLILTLAAQADITLASLFQDHAVLQRDQPVPVWGTAGAGEKVIVEFRGQSAAATAGADGRWQVVLSPMPASAEPASLVVRYAWANAPEAVLMNAAGLSAAPFRTDDWAN